MRIQITAEEEKSLAIIWWWR